jgi:hypothetical protein
VKVLSKGIGQADAIMQADAAASRFIKTHDQDDLERLRAIILDLIELRIEELDAGLCAALRRFVEGHTIH